MRKTMTVRTILVGWLKEHGYDGLYTEDCSCLVDDLCPCEWPCAICGPGYRHDTGDDWDVRPTREGETRDPPE